MISVLLNSRAQVVKISFWTDAVFENSPIFQLGSGRWTAWNPEVIRGGAFRVSRKIHLNQNSIIFRIFGGVTTIWKKKLAQKSLIHLQLVHTLYHSSACAFFRTTLQTSTEKSPWLIIPTQKSRYRQFLCQSPMFSQQRDATRSPLEVW